LKAVAFDDELVPIWNKFKNNKKRLYISTVVYGGGHGMRTPEAVTEISTFQGYGIGSDPMLSPTIPPYRDFRYSTYLISRLL
jgi:hypothetical protein